MSSNKSLSISLRDVTKDNIEQLHVLNNTIFPVRYSQKFYNDIVQATQYAPITRIPVVSGATVSQINTNKSLDSIQSTALTHQSMLCRFAYCNDYVIGATACKLEYNETTKKYNVYIMILCVLAPYRNQSVGTQLINYILSYCTQNSNHIESITAHVQTNNDDAINFYKRHGFTIHDKVVENYYKRITPSSAYFIKRPIDPNPNQ